MPNTCGMFAAVPQATGKKAVAAGSVDDSGWYCSVGSNPTRQNGRQVEFKASRICFHIDPGLIL